MTDTGVNQPKTYPVRNRKAPECYGDSVIGRDLDDTGVFYAYALSAESFVGDTPKCFDEMHQREDADRWMQAVNNEVDSLMKNETWTPENLPENRSVVGCK